MIIVDNNNSSNEEVRNLIEGWFPISYEGHQPDRKHIGLYQLFVCIEGFHI